MKKPSLLIIFLTVFIDLVGFGLVLPLLPNYSKSLGASGFEVGCIMASYSLMQFIFAPIWGAWSDRIGRRPILLVSTAGAALSYAVFAWGSTLSGRSALAILLASRLVAGVCGANITVAQAYIADITPPDQRSKRMGLIGMAFGLGFIVGPALAIAAQSIWGPRGPGQLASSICAINFVLAWKLLPESWKPGAANAAKRARWAYVGQTLQRPVAGFLILVFFLATFGFTCFESTLGLLIQQNFKLSDARSASTNAILFCFAGIIGAFVQAGPIGRLVKQVGERKLIVASLLLFGISMAPLPLFQGTSTLSWTSLTQNADRLQWMGLLASVAVLAVGSGLTRPPLFGLLSNLTAPEEQGATLGVAQSAGSLARVAGPIVSGWLFDRHPAWPYWIVAGIALVTSAWAWRILCQPSSHLTPSPTQRPGA